MLRTECFLSHLQVDLQVHGTTWPYIGILSPTMSEDSGVKVEATEPTLKVDIGQRGHGRMSKSDWLRLVEME